MSHKKVELKEEIHIKKIECWQNRVAEQLHYD